MLVPTIPYTSQQQPDGQFFSGAVFCGKRVDRSVSSAVHGTYAPKVFPSTQVRGEWSGNVSSGLVSIRSGYFLFLGIRTTERSY